MLGKIVKAAEKYSELMIIALPTAIIMIYLYCECGFSIILYDIVPSVLVGLMLLFVYMVWRSYKKEETPPIVTILLCGIAVMLSFILPDAHIYWNRAVYLAWPVLLLLLIRAIVLRRPKGMLFAVQRQSLIYYAAVLPVIWLITANYGLNAGLWKDRVDEVFYLLLLSDITIWNEIYAELESLSGRIKALLFMLAVNSGVFIYLFVRNGRLREVLYSLGFSFANYGGNVPPADWIGYRRAAAQAFLTEDLTALETSYKSEHYNYVLFGDGLASLRFKYGMLPLIFMILFLVLEAVFLWKWKKEETVANKYARYFVISYGIRMFLAFSMEACMFQASHVEFPFTGAMDRAEIVLLIILIFMYKGEEYEKYRPEDGY